MSMKTALLLPLEMILLGQSWGTFLGWAVWEKSLHYVQGGQYIKFDQSSHMSIMYKQMISAYEVARLFSITSN